MKTFTFTLIGEVLLGYDIEAESVEEAREKMIALIVEKDDDLKDRFYDAVNNENGFDGIRITGHCSDYETDREFEVRPFESENGPF